MSIAERLQQKGEQKTAKRMLLRGMSPQFVQEVTELTAQEIEHLQQDLADK